MKINCGQNGYVAAGWEEDDAYVTGGSDWDGFVSVDTSGATDPGPATASDGVASLIWFC